MICALLFALGLCAAPGVQQEIDPTLKAAVDRFFAAQVNEDLEGYMALWSRTATRPQLQQLKHIFESGNDRFLDLEITHASTAGDTARVRGAITRIRTALNSTTPDGSPRMFTTRLEFSLAFVREDGEWKIVREGAPVEELAAALLETADSAVRAEMLEAEADLATPRLVDALARHADQLAQREQYGNALTVYERALEVARALKNRRAEGQMLQNIANSHYFLRNLPAALAVYEKRLALERGAANDEGIASALVGIATIRYSLHEYTPALAVYREALAIQERLNEEALIATTLISTGNVLFLQGDFEGAIADYRRAESLKRKYFDLAGAASALEGLGRAYAAQGDYAGALIAFSRVLDDARTRKDGRREASALQNIGDTHFKLANLDAARAAFDASRQRFESAGDLANAGRVWQGTAVTELLSGRLPHAASAYQNSIAACTGARPASDAECIARALIGLAFTQASQERYDEAIALYRKSIAAFEALKAAEAVGRARVGLAEALSGKGDYATAVKEAVEARHAAVVLESDDLLWRALVAQARAQRRLGQKSESLGAARAAVSAVQRMAAASLQRPAQAVARDTTAAYVTAAVLHAEAGDAASAWTTVEEMRTHALRAAIATNERDIARGMTEEERTAERTAAAETNALFAQRDREQNLPKPDAARLARLNAALEDATARRSTFQKKLFDRLPELRVWRVLAPPANLDEIRTAVPSGTLLVQFVLDDRDLLVLTAERSGAEVIFSAHLATVRRQVLAETVARAVDPSVLSDDEGWRRAAADLVKLLPAQLWAQLSAAGTIAVVPDDVLWRVPFEALPLGTGYLSDRANVTYLSSVTSAVRAPMSVAAAARPNVVIAAAPELSAEIVDSLRTTAPSWNLRRPETAEKELGRIRSAIAADGVTVMTGREATEEGLRVAAGAASVLHVGAPFRVNAGSALFSPVLLSRADSAPDTHPSRNGVLEAREIPNAGFTTRLAVFSDPAALSMRDAAAAVPALQWVLRAGGMETLMLPRWETETAASADLLAAFYETMWRGTPAADALQAARAAARKSGAPPQVWAGCLLITSK